jgi:hypothetical protein
MENLVLHHYSLLARPYDLKEEARLAAIGENASHFRTFLDD